MKVDEKNKVVIDEVNDETVNNNNSTNQSIAGGVNLKSEPDNENVENSSPKSKDIIDEIENDDKKIIKIFGGLVGVFALIVGIVFVSQTCILGHRWVEATCTEAKYCSRCDKVEGEALGHDFAAATCTEPSKCNRCGITTGEPLGHNIENPIIKAATCTEAGEESGTCSRCNQTITKQIQAKGHNYGDYKVTKIATVGVSGEKSQTCTVCGNINTISYDLTSEELYNVSVVKNGTFRGYPNQKIGDTFYSFFAEPTWTATGNIVGFSGKCTWLGQYTDAFIGFSVSGSSFKLESIQIAGITFDNIIDMNSIISKIFTGEA